MESYVQENGYRNFKISSIKLINLHISFILNGQKVSNSGNILVMNTYLNKGGIFLKRNKQKMSTKIVSRQETYKQKNLKRLN